MNGSLRAVLFHLSEAKEALQIRPKTQRELRLTEWKRRMNSDLKFVGRWLKSRKSVVGVEMLTRHGAGCDSKQAIAHSHGYSSWCPASMASAYSRRVVSCCCCYAWLRRR